MFVLRSDNVIYFDVDETLVCWTASNKVKGLVRISDPYIEDGIINVVPHQRNIDLLKRNHGQGHTIVVWSAGGVFWAHNVVQALGLQEYVSLIICKPSVYVDDKPMESWGLNRVYLNLEL